MRYFEDFESGQTFPLGSRQVTRDEIVAFASQYDPQPFHVDEDAAATSAFGGLIASGWHTSAIMMRLYVDALLLDSASMGSPGVSELRWRRPVRPGDTLSGSVVVESTEPSQRRPERGTVHLRWELRNQNGEVVMTMRARSLFARRDG